MWCHTAEISCLWGPGSGSGRPRIAQPRYTDTSQSAGCRSVPQFSPVDEKRPNLPHFERCFFFSVLKYLLKQRQSSKFEKLISYYLMFIPKVKINFLSSNRSIYLPNIIENACFLWMTCLWMPYVILGHTKMHFSHVTRKPSLNAQADLRVCCLHMVKTDFHMTSYRENKALTKRFF